MTAAATTRPRALAFIDVDAPRYVIGTAMLLIVLSSTTITDLFVRLPLKLMSIVSPVLLIGAIFFTPFERLRRTRVSLSLLGFLALGTASMAWSADPASTSLFFLQRGLACYVLTMIALGSQPIEVVLRWVRVAAEAVVAITAVMTVAMGKSRIGQSLDPTLPAQAGWRGSFSNKNAMALYLVMALCAVLALESSRFRRRAFGITAVALIIGSRSSTGLGCLAIIPFYYVSRFALLAATRRERAIRAASSTFAVFVGGIGALFAATPILAALGKDPTLSGRTEIWRQTWFFTKQRPWFGWGINGVFGNTTLVDPTYTIRRRLGFPAAHAHNGLLMVMTEVGVVGLALLVTTLFVVGRRGFRDLVNGDFEGGFLLAGLTLILAISAASESVLSGFNMFLIPLIAAIALHQDRGNARGVRAPAGADA